MSKDKIERAVCIIFIGIFAYLPATDQVKQFNIKYLFELICSAAIILMAVLLLSSFKRKQISSKYIPKG